MSFSFSVQNLKLLNNKIKNKEEEYTKHGLIKFKKIPTQEQQAFLDLNTELQRYSTISVEGRNKMKNSVINIVQFSYLNMRYLAAALVLLHFNSGEKLKELPEEIFNENSECNKEIYRILLSGSQKEKNMNKVKEQIFIYSYLINTNFGDTDVEEDDEENEYDEDEYDEEEEEDEEEDDDEGYRF